MHSLPLSCSRVRRRLLSMAVLSVVLPLLMMLGGCGTTMPPLATLLTAESLPGDPDSSGPVDLEALPGAEALAVTALSEATQDASDPRELRVMSFNVRFRNVLDLGNNWPNRRDLFIATVRRFDPDLLGTQESLISQTRDIQAALPEYGYFGAGRVDGREGGEMCGVFYRKDRFEKIDGGRFWLSRQPDRPGSRAWFEPLPRIVTWVKLEPRDGVGEPFYFFNTHFPAFSRRARENSADLMRQRIASITNGAPVIITGDFNAYEDSYTYRTMLEGRSPESRRFTDSHREVHPEADRHENTIHRFRGVTEGRRIDWILASGPFRTLAADINRTSYSGRYPSDHFPVQAVLAWPASDDTLVAGEGERDADDGS